MTTLAAPMKQSTVTSRELADQINALAAERSILYRQAANGWGDEQREQLKQLDAALAQLWELRRRARAGSDDLDADDAVPVRTAA